MTIAEPLSQFTLLVNAGGESRRMGASKALLPMPANGEPLIRYIARRLLPLAGACVVITSQASVCKAVAPLGAQCLPDVYRDHGPLGGLATGLEQIDGWAICIACDMPFVQPALFRYFCRLAADRNGAGQEQWDVVVPWLDGRYHPLHALYHHRCLLPIRTMLDAGRLRMTSFFEQVRVRRVVEEELYPYDPELRSTFNANTPEEWEEVVALLVQNNDDHLEV